MSKDLLKVQTTKFSCNKPFDQMNPMEKQERIKFLWRKLRSSVRFIKSMGRGGRDITPLGGVDLDELQNPDYAKAKVLKNYRWYILRTN